jgi:hypothetical protein
VGGFFNKFSCQNNHEKPFTFHANGFTRRMEWGKIMFATSFNKGKKALGLLTGKQKTDMP